MKHVSHRSRIVKFIFVQMAFTIVMGGFFPLEPAIIDPHSGPIELFRSTFGFMPEITSEHFIEHFNSAYGDSYQYLLMATGEQSIPPYALRPFYPSIIGKTVSIFVDSQNDIMTFFKFIYLLNSTLNIAILVAGAFFLYHAVEKVCEDQFLSLAIASLFVCNIGTIQTAPFFMLDILSYSISALSVWLFINKRFWPLIICLSIGVLIKEVIVIFTLLPISMVLTEKKFRMLALTFLPIFVFVFIRLFNGEDPLSMQYGWNISKGDISFHYAVSHLTNPLIFIIKIMSALGSVIIGWYLVRQHIAFDLKVISILIFIAIITANILLASRVPRVIFIIYPILALAMASGCRFEQSISSAKPTKNI